MTIIEITTLFGWLSAINSGILIFAAIVLVSIRGSIAKIHSKMFDVSEVDVSKAYFQYLAQYKIVTIVFNIAPYIALKIMAQ